MSRPNHRGQVFLDNEGNPGISYDLAFPLLPKQDSSGNSTHTFSNNGAPSYPYNSDFTIKYLGGKSSGIEIVVPNDPTGWAAQLTCASVDGEAAYIALILGYQVPASLATIMQQARMEQVGTTCHISMATTALPGGATHTRKTNLPSAKLMLDFNRIQQWGSLVNQQTSISASVVNISTVDWKLYHFPTPPTEGEDPVPALVKPEDVQTQDDCVIIAPADNVLSLGLYVIAKPQG